MTPISELSNDSSFESAIEATQQLLHQIETESSSPEAIQADVIHLLNLKKGPRGFFASFLTDPRSFADDPPEAVLEGLKAVPAITADFLVKNLAMSTAMVVLHTRTEDLEAMAGSQQVQTRSQNLIQGLDLTEIRDALNAMILSLIQTDKYSDFLNRWNYDDEQRAAIHDRVISASQYRCIMFES